ncbi:MAG: BspA family leucine-rich repeat surface protein [Marinifilaceae bacterium]|jgi:surface protein|nr:BspA family leucine-rich repeat surface protein [Marinifilaceae bacterium]
MKKNYSYFQIVLTILILFSFGSNGICQNPFITKWKTTKPNEKIKICINDLKKNSNSKFRHFVKSSYDYSVQYSDNGITKNKFGLKSDLIIQFKNPGEHIVEISGKFPAIMYRDKDSMWAKKLIDIIQWGDIQWESMCSAFRATNLSVISAQDIPNLAEVESMKSMFENATKFNSQLNSWNVSSVECFKKMFHNVKEFNKPLNNWNMQNAKNIAFMFCDTDEFNSDISTWNTSSLINMNYCFANTNSFNQDISKWNLTSIKKLKNSLFMAKAFSSENYTKLIMSWANANISTNAEFYVPVKYWSLAKEAKIQLKKRMPNLYDEGSLKPLVMSWETEGVDNSISLALNQERKYDCDYFIDWGDGSEIQNIKNSQNPSHSYESSDVYPISIYGKFPSLCSLSTLETLEDKNENFKTLSQWGDIVWEDLSGAFYNCVNFELTANDIPNLSKVNSLFKTFRGARMFNSNINDWDVSNVSNFAECFTACANFNQPLDKWDMAKATSTSLMFCAAEKFNQDISSWDVSNVRDMKVMFFDVAKFNSDISSWNVSNVEDTQYMFFGAMSFNQDLSNWDVSKVRNMQYMFFNSVEFNSDISEWDVSNVVDMQYMFDNAMSFNTDISAWNTINVRNMCSMFGGAVSFNQDISSWNVSNVEDMSLMLSLTKSFDQDISNWDISKCMNFENIFSYSNISIENYDEILISWADKISNSPSPSSTIDFINQYHTELSTEAISLFEEKGWTVNDKGLLQNPEESGEMLNPSIEEIDTYREGSSSKLDLELQEEELNPLQSVKIYPNPSTDGIIRLRLGDDNLDFVLVKVYTSHGKLIYTKKHYDREFALEKRLNFGNYILQLIKGKYNVTRNITVKR